MHPLLYSIVLLLLSFPFSVSVSVRAVAERRVGRDALGIGRLAIAVSDGTERTSGTRSNLCSTGDTQWNTKLDLKALNFAISLENLVIAFLDAGITRFSEVDFTDAGFSAGTRDVYAGMLANERAHVGLLLATVQSEAFTPIGTCEYDFPVDGVHQFVDLSEAIATLSVSTYTGIIGNLSTAPYVSLLSSILAVEARQASWISSVPKNRKLSNTPFETALSFNYPWSIAKIYVTSCPRSNDPEAVLPPGLKNIPVLNIPSHVAAGEKTKVSFDDSLYTGQNPLYAAFLVGHAEIFVAVEVDEDEGRWVTVPQDLMGAGAVWVVIIQDLRGEGSRSLSVSDRNTVAGPGLVILSSGAGDSGSANRNAWSW